MSDRLPLATRDGRGNLIRAFKASGCAECGRRYPELDWNDLEVDHVDPRDKLRDRISSATSLRGGGGISRFKSGSNEALIAELLICQVLCRECHAAKHRNGDATPDRQLPLFSGDGDWRYS